MNPICLIIGHRRSVQHARRTALFAGWKSRCRFCGQTMVRVAPRTWRLAAEMREQTEEA